MTQQDTKNIIIECNSCYSGDAALEKQEEKEVHEASFDSFTRNRGKFKFSLVINNDNPQKEKEILEKQIQAQKAQEFEKR